MFLKGDVSIVLEFAKKDWDAKPIGIAFGNWFFGIVLFHKSDATQHTLAPDGACPVCWCTKEDNPEGVACACSCHERPAGKA